MRQLLASIIVVLCFTCSAFSQTAITKPTPTSKYTFNSFAGQTISLRITNNIQATNSKKIVMATSFEEIANAVVQSIVNAFPSANFIKNDRQDMLTIIVRIDEYGLSRSFGINGLRYEGVVKYTITMKKGNRIKISTVEGICNERNSFKKKDGSQELQGAFDKANKALFDFINENIDPWRELL